MGKKTQILPLWRGAVLHNCSRSNLLVLFWVHLIPPKDGVFAELQFAEHNKRSRFIFLQKKNCIGCNSCIIYYHVLLSGKDKSNWGCTMRTHLPKLLDLLSFWLDSLNISYKFFFMILFVTNLLNVSKFLPPLILKTLIFY